MGVSIEQYRQQIGVYNGMYNVKGISASKIKLNGPKYSRHRKITILCAFLCLLTSLVIAACCNPSSPCDAQHTRQAVIRAHHHLAGVLSPVCETSEWRKML